MKPNSSERAQYSSLIFWCKVLLYWWIYVALSRAEIRFCSHITTIYKDRMKKKINIKVREFKFHQALSGSARQNCLLHNSLPFWPQNIILYLISKTNYNTSYLKSSITQNTRTVLLKVRQGSHLFLVKSSPKLPRKLCGKYVTINKIVTKDFRVERSKILSLNILTPPPFSPHDFKLGWGHYLVILTDTLYGMLEKKITNSFKLE